MIFEPVSFLLFSTLEDCCNQSMTALALFLSFKNIFLTYSCIFQHFKLLEKNKKIKFINIKKNT
jgi:hypothetical protein